jgi:uncharacterized membrane protein (UPF0127 family)
MTNLRSFAIFTAIPLLLIIGLGYLYMYKNTPPASDAKNGDMLTFAGETFSIEIASTQPAQVRGLSGRSSLPEGTGMLFWFTRDGLYPFWMPDMRFSIDIVWIDKNWTVVHIEEGVAPETYPQTFSSPVPARYVLELPSGTITRINGKIGQKVGLIPGNP